MTESNIAPAQYPQPPAPGYWLASDGQWYPPQPAPQPYPYMPQQPIQNLQGRDGATYVRQQTGHSILMHLILWSWLTGGISLIFALYYTLSPNHYWHV